MINNRIRREVELSLSGFWSKVTPLEEACAGELLEEFARNFVRRDLQKRFRRSFGETGVKHRCLIGGMECDADDTLCAVFRTSSTSPIAGSVVWGSFARPFGYSVVGANMTLDKLFVLEGDSVAAISCGRRRGFLLRGENLERILFFPVVAG